MCGISGIYSPGIKVDRNILQRMNHALSHRGPDDSGFFIDEENNVGLGHTRLTIIDLSSNAHQPMSNDTQDITVTYNGEIYNYREIRRELIRKGHLFTSGSDTEVVVKAYEEWGKSCLKKFIGMYAIAIWDARQKSLFLARDRVGVKTLYYYC